MAEPAMRTEPTAAPMPAHNHAGVGIRFVAILIDSLILGVVTYLIALAFGQTTETGFALSGFPALLSFLVVFGYFILMEKNGATLGKMATGLRVEHEDGGPVQWPDTVIRNLLRIIDALPFAYLLGAILIWTSPKKQRLGDRVGHTIVVRKRV